jgi:predicted membrane protein
MHPISYVRMHPVATVVTFAAGMIVGPWLLNAVGSKTGVNVSLPTIGGNGAS